MKNIKINLISHTEKPLDIMYTACKTCYSEDNAIDIFYNCYKSSKNKREELVLKVLNSGHESIMEHIYLTFCIDGINRSTSHQLVRHRHAVFSQKSQRYIKYSQPFMYTIPESIDKDKRYVTNNHLIDINNQDIKVGELYLSYKDIMKSIQNFYDELIKDGIKLEDARSVLPNACKTSLIMSLNLRSFVHICNERLCTRAQKEIRYMIFLMIKCLLENDKYKFLESFFTPKCEKYKICIEHNSCGKYKKLTQ